jgi:hypothetical protein
LRRSLDDGGDAGTQCDGRAITESEAAQSVETFRCLIRQMPPSGVNVSR